MFVLLIILKTFIYRFLNVYQTMAIAAMTILAPQMLINIRSEMYSPGNLSCPVSTLPWDANIVLESSGTSEILELR